MHCEFLQLVSQNKDSCFKEESETQNVNRMALFVRNRVSSNPTFLLLLFTKINFILLEKREGFAYFRLHVQICFFHVNEPFSLNSVAHTGMHVNTIKFNEYV